MINDDFSKYEIVDFVGLAEKKRRKDWRRAIIWNVVGISILLVIIYFK